MPEFISIIFHSPSANDISPMVNLFSTTDDLVTNLKAALPRMRSRDVSRSCASFLAACDHKQLGGHNINCANLWFPMTVGQPMSEIYARIMENLSYTTIVRINVDEWSVEGLGERIQLPRQQSRDWQVGMKKEEVLRRHELIAEAYRRGEEVWGGKDRACPKCNHVFLAKGNRGQCTRCNFIFYASHPQGKPDDDVV